MLFKIFFQENNINTQANSPLKLVNVEIQVFNNKISDRK